MVWKKFNSPFEDTSEAIETYFDCLTPKQFTQELMSVCQEESKVYVEHLKQNPIYAKRVSRYLTRELDEEQHPHFTFNKLEKHLKK